MKTCRLSNFLDFYILETIKHFVNSDPNAEFDYAKCKLADDVYNELERICGDLTNALHDYVFLASFGEARHAIGTITSTLDAIKVSGMDRFEAYKIAQGYSPEENYKILYNLFTLDGWHGYYGGKLWADVINSLDLIYAKKVPCGIFIDHCADLKHNCGMALDKPIVLEHDYDNSDIMQLLDNKRDAPDFAKHVYDNIDKYIYEPQFMHFKTSQLLRRYLKIYYNINTDIMGTKKYTEYTPIEFENSITSIIDAPEEIDESDNEDTEEVFTEHCDGCGKLRSSHNQYLIKNESFCHACYDKRMALIKDIDETVDNQKLADNLFEIITTSVYHK